ncbi:MAG: hypothetical protein AAF004_11695 [Pseudomonadota bacterium]
MRVAAHTIAYLAASRLLFLLLIVIVAADARSDTHAPGPLLKDAALLAELHVDDNRRVVIGESLVSAPLSCDVYRSALVHFVMPDTTGDAKLILISFKTSFANYNLFPNILYRDEQLGWIRTTIPRTFDGFEHVHVSDADQIVALFMWNTPEATGGQTFVVLSDDGGRHWHYSHILEHHAYFTALDYIRVDTDGSGTAVEYYGGGTSGYKLKGYHVFRTQNHGRTWTDRAYYRSFDVADLRALNLSKFNRQTGRLRETQRLVDIIDAKTLGCENPTALKSLKKEKG